MLLFKRRPKYVHGRSPWRWRRTRIALELLTIVVLVIVPWQLVQSVDYKSVMKIVKGGKMLSTSFKSTDDTKAGPQSSGSPSASVTPPSSTPPAPLPSPRGYGIAAGGGLTYVGDEELNVYFSQLKDLGVTWVRWDLDWGQIQPNNATSYNWEAADRVVAAANRFNINSLVIVGFTPRWARKSACASLSDTCSPADPGVFATFAAKASARYKDKGVQYWEIWNEPNYPQFWQPKPDVVEYVALLKAAYGAIKQADGSAVVLTGGLAALGDEDNDISPLTFVKQMYANGARGFFDGIAVHPYSYPVLPSYQAGWNRWQQLVPIREHMTQQGDSAKKVWITEIGAPTGGPGVAHAVGAGEYGYGHDYMTEEAQAQILSDAVRLYKEYGDWMGPFFWYSLQDHIETHDSPEDFFGILRSDLKPKPAYDTYKNAIR